MITALRRNILITTVTALVLASIALAGPTRVPVGGSIELCTTMRLNPSASSATARLMECDVGDPDDDMGPAALGGGKVSATITNDHGGLSGPNGETQNGGLEGQEIEVKFVVTEKFNNTISLPFGFSFPVETHIVTEIPMGHVIGT